MSNIQKAFKIIERNIDEADFVGAVPIEVINNCQSDLNLKFPKSYIEFLSNYGLGDIFGEEIYGLGVEEVGIPHVKWITLELRKDVNLPNHLVPIYNTGYDNEYYCLDCSKISDSEDDNAPVISFISADESEQEYELIEKDFGTFLYKLLKEAME
ncbi:SMI1/KNR4 family protein [Fictibacillus nanhaiensis]|uniref:SMI1/KNR4 family protein n=1 Tax=Fictibacillus nanhaiensis TaxID=742169 RepID=A0ABS2ZMG2_9BACL|nr:SMI1/KNR4 family protein [Fictibacillus nanhaiensis]